MHPEISIILPCLDEAEALGSCLDQIRMVIEDHHLDAELIVVDNGSTDGSCRIATDHGITPLAEERTGYGFAYLKGFEAARGQYLFLADADGSYDFREIPRFLALLKEGFDVVIGNRFKGNIKPGAMPWKHQYLGNPLLSAALRFFYKTEVQDTQCGMRALTRAALDKMNLQTGGMEFASEMIIMAAKRKLRIKEVPIDYHRRIGRSKLKSMADGWRHLRFMLLYSPLFLFFLPGILMFLAGIIFFALLYFDSLTIFQIRLQYHPLFLAALLITVGYQLMAFALFAKTYAISHLGDEPIFDRIYKYLTIENVSIAGTAIGLIGIGIYASIFLKWVNIQFGELNEIKNAVLALTLVTIGIQTVFSSFMLSILGIKEK